METQKREIKFRAWDIAENEYIDAESLAFDEYLPLVDLLKAPFFEFEQFTGLHDKNGTEIFEGDIVKGYVHEPDKKFFVVFNATKYSCAFVATDNDDCNPYVNLWYDGFEIVGNIHENPELIK